MQFELDVAPGTTRTVISVTGDLDVLTAPQLRDRLIEAIDHGPREIFVDLTSCTFIDSSGLSSLVSALKRVRSLQGDLQLVCPPGNIRRLVELVALDQVFVIHEGLAADG